MTKRKTKPQSKKKRKTKTQSKNWSEQTATAGRIASVIADVLDYDVAMSQDELEAVADAMADAFEFTDAERDEFVAAALINHGGHVGDHEEKED